MHAFWPEAACRLGSVPDALRTQCRKLGAHEGRSQVSSQRSNARGIGLDRSTIIEGLYGSTTQIWAAQSWSVILTMHQWFAKPLMHGVTYDMLHS